jgi:hypothetical protein
MGASKGRKDRQDEAFEGERRDHGKSDKVVRDSYTIPKAEYVRLKALKARCLEKGIAVKKSELLRAGLQALGGMSNARLFALLSRLERVKTGRPAKRDE